MISSTLSQRRHPGPPAATIATPQCTEDLEVWGPDGCRTKPLVQKVPVRASVLYLGGCTHRSLVEGGGPSRWPSWTRPLVLHFWVFFGFARDHLVAGGVLIDEFKKPVPAHAGRATFNTSFGKDAKRGPETNPNTNIHSLKTTGKVGTGGEDNPLFPQLRQGGSHLPSLLSRAPL